MPSWIDFGLGNLVKIESEGGVSHANVGYTITKPGGILLPQGNSLMRPHREWGIPHGNS